MSAEQRETPPNPTLLRSLVEKSIEAFFAVREEEIGEEEWLLLNYTQEMLAKTEGSIHEKMLRLIQESGYQPEDVDLRIRAIEQEETWDDVFHEISLAILDTWIRNNYPQIRAEEDRREEIWSILREKAI